MKKIMATPNHIKYVTHIWSFVLISFFLAAGYIASLTLLNHKIQAVEHHEARMNPLKIEKGYTAPRVLTADEMIQSIPVKTGVYIDRIVEASLRDSAWIVDFYIWFDWKNAQINPGENFHIVDGEVLSKKKKTEYKVGERHYELYRVKAKITKFFDVSRFPLDDHVFTIKIEDSTHKIQTQHYVGDPNTSDLSSRVKVPGYRIYRTGLAVKPHSYKTSLGFPLLAPRHKATYSEFIGSMSYRVGNQI